MYHLKNTTKGMTLIEAVVSVTILTAALTGPMVLASQSLKASRDARAELVATQLASEGIEVVSSIRENNSADDPLTTQDNWMTQDPSGAAQNIIDLCDDGDGCVIDVTDHSGGTWGLNTLIACPSGDCTTLAPVYYYPDSGLYRQSGSALSSPWVETIYRRTVKIEGVDAGINSLRQSRIISMVTYPSFTGNLRTITLTEDIYNWFPALH